MGNVASRQSDAAEDLPRLIAELGDRPERCLLCAAPTPRQLFFAWGKWFWRCSACELIFVHDIYPEFFGGREVLEDPAHFRLRSAPKPSQRKEYARILQGCAAYRRRNRLLEIGCGDGLFLVTATAAGWQCSGVDIMPAAARFAREERGLDVRPGELFDAAFGDGEFDVVYMNEVIEHLVEPVALMREVRRVLRPEGLALVRTGNARSWSARWRGPQWFYYKRFGRLGHIRFYSPQAARALAAAAGFASLSCDTRGFAFMEGAELRGRWFKPFAKLAQMFISPLAGLCGAGHRLTMRCVRSRQ
jgi:SAM-dependent methyltransferase